MTIMPFGVVGGLHSISTANGLTAVTVTFAGESDGTVEQIHYDNYYTKICLRTATIPSSSVVCVSQAEWEETP